MVSGVLQTSQTSNVGVPVGQQDGHGHRGTVSAVAVEHDFRVLVNRPHGFPSDEAFERNGQQFSKLYTF